MQTFLPYASFERSAAVLDQQRLGKQRVESLQVVQALTGRKLEGTFHMEETGRFREKFIDLDESTVINPDEDTMADGYTVVREPILKRIDHPESDWYTIEYEPKGWKNHVVARMWQPHLDVLMRYQMAVCREWTGRGYRDTCLAKTALLMRDSDVQEGPDPWWLGDSRLHTSHMRSLIYKKPDFYGPLWPHLIGENNYFWPVAD